MYHYLHMAENNFRKYLKEEYVWTKKYFYVLRPVLACIWIERGHGVVPIEFGRLVERVVDDATLRSEIDVKGHHIPHPQGHIDSPPQA